jgi:hypothetical protein
LRKKFHFFYFNGRTQFGVNVSYECFESSISGDYQLGKTEIMLYVSTKSNTPPTFNKISTSWALVASSNPSYSGGRDQKDHGSKPAPGK